MSLTTAVSLMFRSTTKSVARRTIYILPLVVAGGVWMLAVGNHSLLFYSAGRRDGIPSAARPLSAAKHDAPALQHSVAGTNGGHALADSTVGSSEPAAAGTTQTPATVTPPATPPGSQHAAAAAQIPAVIPKPVCGLNLTSLVNSYDSDVQKQRQQLDSELTAIPVVGSIIHNSFVDTYNQNVASLLDSYTANAQHSHCVFPVTTPPTLSYSYQP